ncbi:hypothetical protein SLS54_003318 [Diplodia seriata]
MASQSYTNFRLRGIPNHARSRGDVRELVQQVLGLESQTTITVHSLASSPIEKNSAVATLSFESIPDALPPKKFPEWRFPVPTPDNIDEDVILRTRYLFFDTHFHGLTPLHCKEDQECSVDLIAVSGLGGHAFGSFKERDGPFMWLRDSLPWELPTFRIFVYGYDTQLQDSSSFQNLTDLGKELRMSIHETRIIGLQKKNRIIFLGHSLGGLVIKELSSLDHGSTSLGFKEQHLRRDDIIPAEDTCNWILADPRYTDWVRSTHGMLWIKGNPGAGKSTIMKHLWATMQQNVHKELVSSFFIHGRGIQLQKTLLGLYRALLNNLLGHFPDYLGKLCQRFEENERQFGSWENQKWEWNESELQQFFHTFLLDVSKTWPVVIYIDALDECGAEAAQKLLELLKQLDKSAGPRGCCLKICFSSRHYPILGLESVPTIYVEDQNDRDIRRVVRHSLQEIDSVTKRHQIENEIVSRAQGGFQWAVLVVAKAAALNRRGINSQVIYEEIRTIPAELNQLYSGLLHIAEASERKQTRRLFQWVLYAQRPLQISELREALAIDTDSEFHSINSLRTSRYYCDSLPDTERRIKDLSRGLIEIKTREVLAITVDDESFVREAQFIHQSVPDFLNKEMEAALGVFGNEQPPLGLSHSEIARACFTYIGLQELPEAAERSYYYLTNEFPLSSYVVEHYAYHIQTATLEGVPQDGLVNIVQQWIGDSRKFYSILTLWDVLLKDLDLPILWPVRKSTVWHFMACFGLTSAFKARWKYDAKDTDQSDHLGNTPLLLSIQNGHDSIATILLDWTIQSQDRPLEHISAAKSRFFVNPNATNLQTATPMSLAIRRGAGGIQQE